MSIDGSFGVNVVFHDRSDSRIKVLQLEDHKSYATGKVAVVTGTVGTATIAISPLPTTYRDASGAIVAIESVQRFAFVSAGNVARCSVDDVAVRSSNGEVAISGAPLADDSFFINTVAGTAAYTLVLYGT